MKHPPFACLLAGAIAFLLGATAVVSAAGVPKTVRAALPAISPTPSPDEAMALAKRNLVAALRPFDTVVHGFPDEAFGYIRGDYYEASRLTLHDEWAPLAKKAKGSLIVAVPAIDVVLYADSGREQAMRAMTAVALDVVSKAQRPISAMLFKWTPEGWEPVPRQAGHRAGLPWRTSVRSPRCQ